MLAVVRRSGRLRRDPDALFASKTARRKIPFEFVLDAIAEVAPTTRPMFGATAVYANDKIVFALRDKATSTADNGVWLATTEEHHASLRRELPSLRSIAIFGSGTTGWQIVPVESDRFEEDATRACELVVAGDPRIGKIPPKRRKRLAVEAREPPRGRATSAATASRKTPKKAATSAKAKTRKKSGRSSSGR
jgi:hypothetical protein